MNTMCMMHSSEFQWMVYYSVLQGDEVQSGGFIDKLLEVILFWEG